MPAAPASARTAPPAEHGAPRLALPPFPRLDPARLPEPRPLDHLAARTGAQPEHDAPPTDRIPLETVRVDVRSYSHERAESLPEWSLVLADGVTVPLYGTVVVGRNPSADRFPHATITAVHDPTRTMSKTHARFSVEDDALIVEDLNSTNGIALLPGGNRQGATEVRPGETAALRSGDTVMLGEYPLAIRRN